MNSSILERTNKKIMQNENLEKHVFELKSRKYQVHPHVFSPNIFLGTEWLTQTLIKLLTQRKPSSVLEIGVGCGCILIQILLSYSQIQGFGVDVNPYAVQNTLKNMKDHKVQGKVIESDVLDSIPKQQKFDIVFWNYPFHPTQKQYSQLGMIEKGVRDPGYRCLYKLFQSIPSHLKQNGQILLGFSLTMADLDLLKQVAHKFGYTYAILQKMTTGGTICLIKVFKP